MSSVTEAVAEKGDDAAEEGGTGHGDGEVDGCRGRGCRSGRRPTEAQGAAEVLMQAMAMVA